MAHRVVLIREWDIRSDGGGGCCGDIQGFGHEHVPARCEQARTRQSAVYLALSRDLPADVELTVAEAGNVAWLLPALYADARRTGQPRAEAARAAIRAASPGTLVVDGRIVRRGGLPDPAEAVRLVREALARTGV